MKKSILVLILASFAGITVVWGQALPGSAPRPLVCTTGPFNPVAGVPYDYSANLSPDGGTAYWFATTTTNFISGGNLTSDQELEGGDFVMPGAINYQNNTSGVTSPNTTTITWNSVGLATVDDANPLFVALYYEGAPTGCSDNFKVYRIDPVNAFMINVLNLGGFYSTPVESCYDSVASASYDLVLECMTYDYGVDTLAFEIVASNFTGSYTPSFRVEGVQVGTSVDVLWSYTPLSSTGINIGTLAAPGIVVGDLVSTTVPNTSTGVSIYVWLVVHHQTYEGLSNDLLTLAAAGVNAAGENCVRWNDCNIEVDINAPLTDPDGPDYADHTLNARPNVTPVAPGVFEGPCAK